MLSDQAAWFGKPGQLIPLPNQAGSIEIDHERATSTQTAITGARVAQYAPTTRRAWKITIPELSPVEKGTVIAGFRAIGYPWALVTIDAWMHNAMSPESSYFDGWTSGSAVKAGPAVLPTDSEGRVPNLIAPARIVASSWTYFGLGRAPVIPGVPVTASIWGKRMDASRGVFVKIRFLDAAGAEIASRASGSNLAPGWNRTWITDTAPPGAAWAWIDVAAGEWAAPAISWTPTVTDWTEGMGAENAVPSAPKLALSQNVDGARWDIELALTEVG